MLRKLIAVFASVGLAFVGIGLGGCDKKPADTRYQYPAADEDRARPRSRIPQLGTDGFVKDD